MTDMDIAGMWRNWRADPADVPHAGARLATAEPGITISVAQECQIALPPRSNLIPAVSVTVTSQRPGIGAQVTIAANFNTPDGSYQGPTTTLGQGQFTATISQVQVHFVLLPSGFPVLGVGAVADWADGAHSATLTYEQIACDPWVWWRWVTPIIGILSRSFSAVTSAMPLRGRSG
jgi:hypothetical protein